MLLAALATLQYRWLGEVSEAERERMRARLRTRASEFTQEFDAELTRIYVAFQIDARSARRAIPPRRLATRTRSWQAATAAPALVRGVYLAGGHDVRVGQLQRFDPGTARSSRPSGRRSFARLLQRTPRLLPQIAGMPPPMLMADAVDAAMPALIIPRAAPDAIEDGDGSRASRRPAPTGAC